MKGLIVVLFALKPATFWFVGTTILGVGFFDFVAILMNALLLIAFLVGIMTKRFGIVKNNIDILIIAFSCWCLLLLFHPNSSVKETMQLLLPLFNFFVVCRYFKNEQDILKLLRAILIGFSVPIIASAIYTFLGLNLDMVIYLTGVERYRGVFANIHNMGLSMVMFIFLLSIYLGLSKHWNSNVTVSMKIFMAICFILAMYCLNKSVVRTAFLSLLVFFIIYYWFYNKKILVIGVFVGLLGIGIFFEKFETIMFDVFEATSEEGNIDQAGSGRISIWKHQFGILNEGGVISWIVGTGVGSRPNISSLLYHGRAIDSHNDYLELVMNTGLVGCLIYLAITLLMLSKALKLRRSVRYIFVAVVLATIAANFVSNSFIARFGLAQLFMLMMGIMFSVSTIDAQKFLRQKAERERFRTQEGLESSIS